MEVLKTKGDVGTYDICIEENPDKHLALIWGGNGDLYWFLDNMEVVDNQEDSMYDFFCITKGDYALYTLFEELYDDLMTGKVFVPSKHFNTNVPDLTEEEQKEVDEYNAREVAKADSMNAELKEDRRYQRLTADNVITWYSDEEEKSNAEILRISKQEDAILLEFIRQSTKDDSGSLRMPGYYSIRFRTSGSTYTPCDLVFTRHFLKMQEHDFNASRQIHIEEWLYHQKLLQKKKQEQK